MNAIQINSYSKSFGNKVIFSNFNCTIKTGEMVAITGPSGSGKTILLNTIGLIENMDLGELYLFGNKGPTVDTKASTILIREKISYLFQNYALVDNFSVVENLFMALKYVKFSNDQKEKIVKDALEKVGLSGYDSFKVYELSGGEQQRVSLARSIIKPSNLILADEPTGSLDTKNREIVLNILKDINKQGKTVVIVTHDKYVSEQCDRVIKLSKRS